MMMYCSLKKYSWGDVTLGVVFLAAGLMILFLSISRVGLEILAKDDGEAKVKQRVVFLDTVPSSTYMLPLPGMLPTHPFYWAKEVRNWSWISLSKEENKVRLILLLADKKWAEMMELWKAGNKKVAIRTGMEAINKLKYADSLISSSTTPADVYKQEREILLAAGMAYEEMLQTEAANDKDIKDLMTNLHEWNQKQEKERAEWSK